MDSIFDLVSKLCVPPPSDDLEEDTKNLFASLSELPKPCLLVIDNANEIDDLRENYQNLKSLSNFNIIITSRINEFQNLKIYSIDGLGEEQSISLFRNYFPKLKPEEETIVLDIRKSVDAISWFWSYWPKICMPKTG